MENKQKVPNSTPFFLYLFIPTIMLITGYFIYPYPSSSFAQSLSFIPLFLGLILLGVGFVLNQEKNIGRLLKISGWLSFSFYWALQPAHLYLPSSDIFNGAVGIIGVYVLIYVAYHEWLSIKRNEHVSCLNWIAGGTFLAGIIYFLIDSSLFPILKDVLIEIVAANSTDLMNILGLSAQRDGHYIIYEGTSIRIIFACTAIQSMVLFIGMIGALAHVKLKRKIIAFAVTVIPIYFLNLIRNASVIFLVGSNLTSFEMAHNVIAKAGSLLALIILLFIVFRILPELYDEIICLVDLPKRKGPVERFIHTLMGKKEK